MTESQENEAPALRRAALIAAVASSFLTPFMGSSINVALPSIARQFSMSALQSSFVATAYLLSAGMFLIPFGRLSDIHGRKKIFLIGMVVYVIFSICLIVAPGGLSIIAFRFFQGIGGAMIFGTGMTILVSVYPKNERGRVLGINVAAVYLGATLGPFLGGVLTEHFTWRSVFAFNAVLAIAATVFVFLYLKGEWAESKGEPFDTKGSVVYSLSLALVLAGSAKLTTPAGAAIAIAGVLGLAGFIWYESRIQHPVLPVKMLWGNRIFFFTTTTAMINYSATFGVGFLVSLYLQYLKGLTPTQAGLILLAQPVVQTVFSPFAGKRADKVDAQALASVGMAITAAGLAMLIAIGPATPLWWIVASLSVLGLGFALFSSPNTTAAMNAVERKHYAVASGILSTMRVLGQVASMALVTVLFAVFLGSAQITDANHAVFVGCLRLLFIVFAALCAGGVFLRHAKGRH